jgi:HAD superfamily hydrolase (TIGR01509 family)
VKETGSAEGRYRGVFFDWDGCLADTLGLWMDLYKGSLAARGIHAEEQSIVRELFNDWSGPARFGVEDTAAFVEEIIHGLEERICDVRLNPEVGDSLQSLKQRGRTTAILTGSKRSFVEPVLHREGIESAVDLLVCLDDVVKLKPHPEAVDIALRALDIPREQVLMVGDSTKDIEMGRNAGIATVLYFPEKNRRYYELDRLQSYGPDYTIGDFRELEKLLE